MGQINIKDSDEERMSELLVHLPDTRPHWQNSGSGYAQIMFTLHKVAKWLSINAVERSHNTSASKRTMITLDEAGARALYEQLHKVFGDTKRTEIAEAKVAYYENALCLPTSDMRALRSGVAVKEPSPTRLQEILDALQWASDMMDRTEVVYAQGHDAHMRAKVVSILGKRIA